jgi:hypothetical protein
MTTQVNPEGFKTCPLCGAQWPTIEDLVRDRAVSVDGYTAFFDDPGAGLIFITHRSPDCGTTMTIKAAQFMPLYSGPIHMVSHKGATDCRRLCLDRHSLEDCDAPCAMAWVRVVLRCLRRHLMPEEAG